MFPLQNQCNGIVDRARIICNQFFRVYPPPLLPVTNKSYGFAQSSLQDEVQKHPMMFLHSLSPTSFSGVFHDVFIHVFHDLVKHSTIKKIELKQNALSNLSGIVNDLCTLEDNVLKNDHPLSVTLTRTDPIKFYRQDSHKSLPNFPGRCLIALGWHTINFFPPLFPLNIFLY